MPINNVAIASLSLRPTPGFALTVVLTLALGIGLSTAMFTVAQGPLRDPAVRDQDRVVVLWGRAADG